MRTLRDQTLRFVTVGIVLALGAIGFIYNDLLISGAAWLAFLFFGFSGWGYFVVRIARIRDVDFGLRTAWGIAAFLAVAGIPLAIGVCSRPVLIAFVACGFAGFVWRESTVDTASWQSIRGAALWMRANPALAVLASVLVAIALFQVLGALAKLDRNPWDDDLAYTPLVRRLLDIGDLQEPFSFRRLASYGGQTVLQGLAGARGSIASVHLIDQGLGFGLTLLLIAGHARRLGRVPVIWVATILLLVLLMPDMSINTASYWTGAAMFLALYRTVALTETPARTTFVIASLVGAAAGTLRQNYLLVAALFIATALLFRLRTSPWRVERRTWMMALATAVCICLPWCIAAYRSGNTFLFPIVEGNFNHAMSLKPTGTTLLDTVEFVVTAALESQPLAIIPILFLVTVATRDCRPERPLTALFAAAFVGFVFLASSFTGADTASLWRYAFGVNVALTSMLVLEVGNDDEDARPSLAPIGRWLLLAALMLQIGFVRAGVTKQFVGIARDIREARALDYRGDATARADARRYARMQSAIPAHERVAVMVDDPGFLDFERNDIVNLDTPGYASPGPQLPMFCGPDALRRYFLSDGERYVAFVRPMASRYFFRRDFWFWRLFYDSELFQVMSAYTIDAIDSFTELAKHVRVVYDQDGLVVLDLMVAGPMPEQPCDKDESARRDAFVRRLVTSEGLADATPLMGRRDVIFSDGVSNITFIDPNADPTWRGLRVPDPAPRDGKPVRWLHRRAHLRLRGDADMHLTLKGRIRLHALYTRPRLDVSIAGESMASVVADENGFFVIDVDVPARLLDGWTDVYVLFSTIGTPEKDVADLRIAELRELSWEPRSH
jgi:hypothetical protein